MMDIPIGEPLRRTDVHQRFGGNERAGICPSLKSNVILLFANTRRGREHGYVDGWGKDDGFYYYSGQGRYGDQLMNHNNRALLSHATMGREVHLFAAVAERRSFVMRVGQFLVWPQDPWFSVDAPDENGELRRMIVFRLQPVGETLPPAGPPAPMPSPQLTVTFIPLPRHTAQQAAVSKQREAHQAVLREAPLVESFREHLEALGHTVVRNEIFPRGEVNALYTDLHDRTDNLLVEAKGTVTREAVRMAVGQLLDYRRYITPRPDVAILVPVQPRSDLIDFCAAENIATIWPEGDSFRRHTV